MWSNRKKIDKFLRLLDKFDACDLLNSLIKEKQKSVNQEAKDNYKYAK